MNFVVNEIELLEFEGSY